MYSILITFFIYILIFCAGGPLSFLLFFKLFIGAMTVYATGFSLFTVVQVNNLKCRNLVYFVTGFIITNLFIYFISTGLNISVGQSFLYFSIGIFLYILIFQPRSFFQNILFIHERTDLLIFSFLIGFTLIWCWQIAESFPTLLSIGVLPTWIDAYFHGAEIAQFSDIKSAGQGDIFLAGVSPFLYHRAMYMLPATIAEVAHLSGLAAATALLLPVGFLLLASTIYCLGTQLANRMTGFLAAIFLLVLPDNSWLGLKNGFLGFRYIIQVAPGTAYGLAGCLISILFFAIWLREKSHTNAILLSLFFAVCLYFFRVHFFVLYFPVFIASLLCASYYEKKYFWQLMWLAFTCVLILMCFFAAKNSVVIPFLKLVHLDRGVNLYTDFYKYINDLNQPFLMIFTGIILLIGGILGIWIILYPLLLWIKTRQFGWEKIDFIPLILLVCYISLVLFAPAMYQMPDELQHRPSGLLYAVIIIFSIVYATRILNHHKWKHFFDYTQLTFVVGVFYGVFLTSFHPNNVPLRVLFRGYSLFQDYHLPLKNDILQVAVFLGKKAVPEEIFLTSKDDTDKYNVDSAVVVSSISGMPSYLGQPLSQSSHASLTRLSIIRHRDSVIRRSIVNASTREEAFKRMRANHISWYIALYYPKWDKLGKASDFKSDSVALYHAL